VTFQSPESSLSASLVLLQSLTRPTLASPGRSRQGTSPELSCPSAHADRRVHVARALPARRFRLQGLATLLTAFSSASLADLVSDRQHSWASPFEAFPSRRVPRHSCRADPRAVNPPVRHWPVGQCQAGEHRLLGFAPVASPLQASRAVNPTAAGGSRGLWPFQGALTARLAATFAAAPLTCLALRPTVATRSTCTLESRSPCAFPVPASRTGTPHRVSHLSRPTVQDVRNPGYGFTLPAARHC